MIYRIIGLVLFLLIANKSTSQYEKYTHDIGIGKKINIQKLYELIRKDTVKNIFLLSESAHSYINLENIRVQLISEIIRNKTPELIYYENTWENDFLLKKFFKGELNVGKYIDSIYVKAYNDSSRFIKTIAPYSLFLQEEYDSLHKTNYSYFMKNMLARNYFSRIRGIDIGTTTLKIGLYYLCELTQEKYGSNNNVINTFVSRIKKNYRGDFLWTTNFVDTKSDFLEKVKQFDSFTKEMQSISGNIELILAWKSVFASYIQSNNYRVSVNESVSTEGDRDLKEFLEFNSFRDSVIYSNFKFLLPQQWHNIIISFSTLHLMDTRDTVAFSDVMSPSSKTFGQYLHSEHYPFLRRIAFVCDEGSSFIKKRTSKSYAKSLEHTLSKDYEFAYVDLYKFRNSIDPKVPFFMKPTFLKYQKLNWENLFDGVVFIKHCTCKSI